MFLKDRVQLNLVLDPSVDELLTELATEAGVDRADIIRRGLGVLSACRHMRHTGGQTHLGFTSDPSKLDAELINVWPNS